MHTQTGLRQRSPEEPSRSSPALGCAHESPQARAAPSQHILSQLLTMGNASALPSRGGTVNNPCRQSPALPRILQPQPALSQSPDPARPPQPTPGTHCASPAQQGAVPPSWPWGFRRGCSGNASSRMYFNAIKVLLIADAYFLCAPVTLPCSLHPC